MNKVDRPGARPHWVVDQVFDLFVRLGATDEQLDFPVIYTSALQGYAMKDMDHPETDMHVLLDMIVEKVKPPQVDPSGPFQMQISALDYSSYVGAIGVGRIKRGRIKTNTPVTVIDAEGKSRSARVLQVLGFMGLKREEVPAAEAGDIIAVTGISNIHISDTLCDPSKPEALPMLSVDEPTVSMTFQVNDSPFAGKEGKFVTSRQISDRLDRELISNVALKVEPGPDADQFIVSGRGELHLAILIEIMRREGFELAVSRPSVITKTIDGVLSEPFEQLVVDVEETHQGTIMQQLAERRGQLTDMMPDGKGRVRLTYMIPTRGLIGFHAQFLMMTSGSGVMYHVFDHYGPAQGATIQHRSRGVLIANGPGKATGFSLFNLQERGQLFIGPQVEVYEGMIIGIHSRENDLIVNPTKAKQLTNMRASGSDENIILTPPIKQSLEQALAFINDDELVEITPQSIRLRKKELKEIDRKRTSRQ